MAQTVHLPQPLHGVRSQTRAPVSRPLTATETIERAAYERGRQEAERALQGQLLAQGKEFLELQRGVLQAMRNAMPQLVRDSETALIHLAIETAQRLVAGLPVSAEMVEAAVREALAQVADTSEVTVLLNAEDLALLEKHPDGKSALAREQPQIVFRSSPEVTRGGCLVQTRFGVVDGRRETKVELLKTNAVS
ncbi:MAG TPA: FliH/SctL family protein [Verrucomicrobiae bacterium]|nr:FliH/SctL family protein [Verrucomicrobiae bacterium]